MPKRERDAFLRNSRPLTQQRFDKPPKPKMPKKGTTIRIKYNDSEIDQAIRAKEIIERFGMICELVKDD